MGGGIVDVVKKRAERRRGTHIRPETELFNEGHMR